MKNDSIQVSASDVEDAIQKGLAQLGLSRQEVEIEIVDQGSRGLLGLGAREAVVRLRAIQAPPPPPPPEPEEEPILQDGEPDEEEYGWSADQMAEVAQQTLVELLNQMGIDADVAVRWDKPVDDEPAPLTLDVSGPDLDVLVGRQGEVLNALQYITRLIVSREVQQWVDLVVDVQHYKERRAKSLEQLASRIAERVAQTKQPVALEPMPPNERRAIHVALRDHPAVTTQSVGKGDRRKVTIIPKR